MVSGAFWKKPSNGIGCDATMAIWKPNFLILSTLTFAIVGRVNLK